MLEQAPAVSGPSSDAALATSSTAALGEDEQDTLKQQLRGAGSSTHLDRAAILAAMLHAGVSPSDPMALAKIDQGLAQAVLHAQYETTAKIMDEWSKSEHRIARANKAAAAKHEQLSQLCARVARGAEKLRNDLLHQGRLAEVVPPAAPPNALVRHVPTQQLAALSPPTAAGALHRT